MALVQTTKPLHEYFSNYRLKRIKKGQTILFQGEVPRLVYILKSGAVKAYNIDPNGEEKIIALIGPNEVIAPSWAYGKAPVALFYYDAFSDVELYTLPKEDLISKFVQDRDALLTAFDKLASLFTGASFHINALEEPKSSQKLASLLHYLTIRFGKPTASGKILIQVRLTQQDIARMLGLTRETVATELSKLKKDRVLSYKTQHYLIDPDKLQRLHGEEDFNNVKIQT
jgi:CRP-like cAMP-binding protein